jgi:HEPN domain-containing protein
MKAITQQWLDYAKADLMNCEQIFDNAFLSNIISYHSQQTIEKCFKAIVEQNGLKFERIHNLFKLQSKIESYITFEVDLDKLELLDKVYTSSRYPGEIGLMPDGKPALEIAQQQYVFAKYVYEKTIAMLEIQNRNTSSKRVN